MLNTGGQAVLVVEKATKWKTMIRMGEFLEEELSESCNNTWNNSAWLSQEKRLGGLIPSQMISQ